MMVQPASCAKKDLANQPGRSPEMGQIKQACPDLTALVLAAVLLGLAMPASSAGGQATLPASDLPNGAFSAYPVRDVVIPPPEELGPEKPAADPSLPTGPPDNPEVGDSWLWWLFYHTPMPPHFEQMICTVRGKTDRGYVIVEESQWELNIFQSDVDVILDKWENSSLGIHPDMGIYELDSLYFGEPPDELDDDRRVYLVWFDIGTFGDGFFFWFDEYPDGTYDPYRSNECEALYLSATATQGPSSDYMISVAAHELEHMIHWKYDDDESAWVDEGMGELAMWFYGRPDDISAFNSNADNSLIEWDGLWADYIKTYLWSLYYYERYGGGEAVHDIVHHPLNSIGGYEAVLDSFGYQENFADVFADWAVANFLDDTSIADGRFGYEGDDLPSFGVMASYSAYPVLDQSSTVSHWATDYYRFENLDGFTSLELAFDGADDNSFAVWGLGLHADSPTDVLRMELDPSTQSGSLALSGLGEANDRVILVVAGASSTGGTGYVFGAQAGQTDADGDPGSTMDDIAPDALVLETAPNPADGPVRLTVTGGVIGGELPQVTIYNTSGHAVRGLVAPAAEGRTTVVWDRRDATGKPVPAGVYYARAIAGDRTSGRQIILIR
jgi:hypothetical protein